MGQSESKVDGQVDEIVQSTGTHVIEFEGKSPGLVELAIYNLIAIIAVGIALGIWKCLSNCTNCRDNHRTPAAPQVTPPTSSALHTCPNLHNPSYQPLTGCGTSTVNSWHPHHDQPALPFHLDDRTNLPRIILDPAAMMAHYYHLRHEHQHIRQHGRQPSASRTNHAFPASDARTDATTMTPPQAATGQMPQESDSVSQIMVFP